LAHRWLRLELLDGAAAETAVSNGTPWVLHAASGMARHRERVEGLLRGGTTGAGYWLTAIGR
jgi:hypothetical protein